jgi:hypothetical protein
MEPIDARQWILPLRFFALLLRLYLYGICFTAKNAKPDKSTQSTATSIQRLLLKSEDPLNVLRDYVHFEIDVIAWQ